MVLVGMIWLREESRRLSVARRGASAVSACAFLAGLSAVSGDPALAAAGAVGLAAVAADFLERRGRGRTGAESRGEPDGGTLIRATSVAGEEVELSLELAVPRGAGEVTSFGAEAPFKVAGFSRTEEGGGGYALVVKAKPELYGEYELRRLYAASHSRLGLFGSRSTLVLPQGAGIGQEEPPGEETQRAHLGDTEKSPGAVQPIARLKVYPRFYPLLLEALWLLGEGPEPGGAGAMAARRRLGRGEEYAWSREYEPWDSPRFIDWKATARRGRMMVKDFFEDPAGRGLLVFFDGRAPGRMSADEMARDLLSVALGLAGTGQKAVLVMNRGDSYRKVEGAWEEVLRGALLGVFESVKEADPEAFSVFPPSVGSSLLRALGRGEEPRPVRGGAHREAIRALRSGIGGLAYVGCPLFGVAETLGLMSEAASAGAQVRAFLPTKPWLDARSLEEAYEWRISWSKIVESVAKITYYKRAVITAQ